jgi:hypothetical protein
MIKGFRAFLGQTNRPAAWFRDQGTLVISDSHVECRGGQQWIDIDNCDQVSIENCSGNVELRYNRRPVGKLEEGFVS